MLFSIIIPTYKDWDRLKLCLDSLIDAQKGDFDYEIIVVDNAQHHAPPEFIKSLSKIILVHEPKPGSYSARNTGASNASGKYLAFTDSDCIPDENWLVNAKTCFDTENCDLIGGRIDIFKEDMGGEWAYIYEKNIAFPQSQNVPKGKAVTANLFVKNMVFKQVDGFDSSLKSGGDWDFSTRAVENGYKLIYAEEVAVSHPARKRIRDILKKQKRFAAWGYLKAKRRFGYSGIRVLAGNLYHEIIRIFKTTGKASRLKEKTIIFIISSEIYLFKSFYQLLFVLRLVNPKKIRE
ncbi:MAG: glycosyltransferase [Balneolaceae bacterium]|nr:glycosyltransferase [Balneolaceae bacterium]